MARYKLPPDPRDPNAEPTTWSSSMPAQEPVPWKWFAVGLLVALMGLGLAASLAVSLLARPPLEVAGLPEPDLIVLTAPPSPTPSVTPDFVLPTPIPTFTPIPTPDNAVAPSEITVGFYARVIDTGGAGLVMRGGPSTSNVQITLVDEGGYLLVIGGPEEGDDLFWWQVEVADGTNGWVAARFLEPAAAP
ncbi:MAG: SH3 domain-containing protein [Chloroflexota bacterium]